MCVLIPVKGIRGLIERTNLHCTRAAQDCLGNACVYGFSQLTQTVNEDFGCPVFIGRNTSVLMVYIHLILDHLIRLQLSEKLRFSISRK